jgi:hypothetical protein
VWRNRHAPRQIEADEVLMNFSTMVARPVNEKDIYSARVIKHMSIVSSSYCPSVGWMNRRRVRSPRDLRSPQTARHLAAGLL